MNESGRLSSRVLECVDTAEAGLELLHIRDEQHAG